MSKKIIYFAEVDDEELGQLDFRQEFFSNEEYQKLEEGALPGFVKGKFRLRLEWLSEDDCDCIGFGHVQGCPNGLQDGEIAF